MFESNIDFPADDFDDSSSNDSNVELSNDSSDVEEALTQYTSDQKATPDASDKMMFNLGTKTGG